MKYVRLFWREGVIQISLFVFATVFGSLSLITETNPFDSTHYTVQQIWIRRGIATLSSAIALLVFFAFMDRFIQKLKKTKDNVDEKNKSRH